MTCEKFVKLADNGYYDGTRFHRAIKDFLIQAGDPTGSGQLGRCHEDDTKYHAEITPVLKFTGAGILASANNDTESKGNQFFVTLAPCPWLDGQYTIFGRVATGMKVVKRIGLVPTDDSDQPLQSIVIRNAKPYTGEDPPSA